jgi:thioredoxin 1
MTPAVHSIGGKMEEMDMNSNALYLTDATFDHEIQGARSPVLVDFWAPWCHACRSTAPILDQVAIEEADRLIVAHLDVDAHPTTADRFAVAGLPTLILFKEGRAVERLVGFQYGTRIREFVRRHLDAIVEQVA